jgi:hypothetical protein
VADQRQQPDQEADAEGDQVAQRDADAERGRTCEVGGELHAEREGGEQEAGQAAQQHDHRHLAHVAREHVQEEVDRLHQVDLDRARAHLRGDVVARARRGVHDGRQQHAEHAVAGHLLEADAEGVGRLLVEDVPDRVAGVHHEEGRQQADPEIDAVDRRVAEGRADEPELRLEHCTSTGSSASLSGSLVWRGEYSTARGRAGSSWRTMRARRPW